MSCKKLPFISQDEVRVHLKKYAKRGYNKAYGNVRPYKCQVCGYWHIGSKKKDRV